MILLVTQSQSAERRRERRRGEGVSVPLMEVDYGSRWERGKMGSSNLFLFPSSSGKDKNKNVLQVRGAEVGRPL